MNRIRRSTRGSLVTAATLLVGALPLAAQYPLAPTPAVTLRTITRDPKLGGYVSVRETVRADTATMVVNRARVTMQALAAPFAAVRLQGDFSAAGRAVGGTVPAFVLTDAFVQLAPEERPTDPAPTIRPALLLGQFKTPFSLEYLTPFTVLATASRSQAVERLAPKRDIGAMGYLALPTVGTLSVAVVNGGGPNRTTAVARTQQIMGRLTLFPLPTLAVSGKWLGQDDDRRWGYDARWASGAAIVEGEVIRRTGPVSPAAAIPTTDASGGYALAAYRVLPWLRPVVRWEQTREQLSSATGVRESSLTWVTYGVSLLAPQERLRAQLDWLTTSDQPIARRDELVVQLQAIF